MNVPCSLLCALFLLVTACGDEAPRARSTAHNLEDGADLIELRDLIEQPDDAAVPALIRTLSERHGSSHGTRYAAAAALYAVGTREALQAVRADARLADFDGGLALAGAFRNIRVRRLRDVYLREIVLQNDGAAPALELRSVKSPTKGVFALEIVVRNTRDEPLTMTDPAGHEGELLLLRHADGHVLQTLWTGLGDGPERKQLTLAPGEARTYAVQVSVLPAEKQSPDARVLSYGFGAKSGGYEYALRGAGPHEVIAWWTAPGARSVSKPVRVEIEAPPAK